MLNAKRLLLLLTVAAGFACNGIVGIEDLPVHADAGTDSGAGAGGSAAVQGADAGGAPVDSGDASAVDAAPAVCGDGIIETGEQCDSGKDGGTSRCSPTCKVICPEYYHGFAWTDPVTHHCYDVGDWQGSANWQDAVVTCANHGGHLATVTSAEELDVLRLHVPNATWIGGSRIDEAGAFSWVDGEPWGYTSWATPTEPNKVGCVELSGSPRNFVVSDCTTVQSYVCEWDPEGTKP